MNSRGTPTKELDKFKQDGLIDWIPASCYEQAREIMGSLTRCMLDRINLEEGSRYLYLDESESYAIRREMEEKFEYTELRHFMTTLIDRIFYLKPVVHTNLSHLRFKMDPLETLLLPYSERKTTLIPSLPKQLEEEYAFLSDYEQDMPSWNGSYLGAMQFGKLLDSDQRWDQMDLAGIKNFNIKDFFKNNELKWMQAALLDSLIGSLSLEIFAAQTQLPIKTYPGSSHLSSC